MKYLLFFFLMAVPPVFAGDFGNPQDVQAVHAVVQSKLGQVANISVAHDWAMCISNKDDSDWTVLLHRVGGKWRIVDKVGGAYQAGDLRQKGVPAGDVPTLLKTYQ